MTSLAWLRLDDDNEEKEGRVSNDHGEQAVGETTEWYTPPEFFTRLGIGFDLDPASPGASVVPWLPAIRHITPRENGLLQPWAGNVWLNPPYGPQAVPFLHRLAEHGEGIALVFSRTETIWWQSVAPRADLVCFLRDRLHHIRADGHQGRAAMGSALLVFGDRNIRPVLDADLGWSVALDGGARFGSMPSGLAPALRGLGARVDAPAACSPFEDET